MKVIIASHNPVKIESTKVGFETVFKDVEFDFNGMTSESGVSDQPFSEEETLTGAINRVGYIKSENPDADFWVGIEGGCKERENQLENFAWIVIESKSGLVGKARTGSFFLPPKVAQLVHGGMELGHADDLVFGVTNSKQATGALGILTKNILTRQTYYEPAVIMALIPHLNPDLYPKS